jgi:hypothetical protein
MAIAIVRQLDGKVQTFVRDDVPEGWLPPEGFDAIPESQLPAGWVRVDATTSGELKDKIAAMRWDRETAGITIGTQPVSTLREEMPVWQGMLLDITLQPGVRSEYEYKPRNGANVVLTPQQVQRCYQCFAWYVSACFATERYLCGLIDAGTPLEQVEAMLDTVWPQTQFDWVAPE